ncbi:alpha/beta-hydrolase [Penicillium macrosclerotiorum]|uniref:alpha/beta-hydrolase n=1 Tax=Penicillium macrosclerotiorum TaxID=303699 RepID=UPI00254764AC|nr:alpha/beta-hydrolase [Penicillium macrosclerotiorum]KAJ5692540.1 alpha/beta-hydrolase [Penicillium macrosclerotiorum]
MSAEKPTVLLIPGAWIPGSSFEPVADILRLHGYPAETMTLLSAGGPVSTTVADDAENIREKHLKNLVAQGKEVVVVMHSYSGIPGTESIKGLARKDLAAQGKKGGVIALVYATAFLVEKGTTVQTIIGDNMEHAMIEDGDVFHARDPREKFFSDLDDETAAKHVATLVPHAKPSFFTPLTYEAWRDVPTAFLFCKQDASIPFEYQQSMAAMPGEGVVRTYSCEAGHAVMVSMPEVVADVIRDVTTNGAQV